jgi:protein-S-isoprenylcysteine O-methyltransferase Ste14
MDQSDAMSDYLVMFCQWLWAILVIYWIYSGRRIRAVRVRESPKSRFLHLEFVVTGFAILMEGSLLPPPLSHTIFSNDLMAKLIGAILTALGIGFALWARAILGQNWSASVTLKEQHELIQVGPYKWVRHPIYTGIVGAAVGAAFVSNRVSGMIGIFYIFSAYLLKIENEELLLAGHFKETYEAYKTQTKRLIPFVY